MDTPPPLPSPVPSPVPEYRDRHTWLIVFGAFEIIMGAFCLLVVPLTVVGQLMAAKQTGAEVSLSLIAQSLVTVLLMAIGLIWVGIGSIKARRWARALSLCFGWLGLCVGGVSLGIVAASLGSMEEMMRQQGQELPPGSVEVAQFVAVATVLFIYVLIPGALVLFYRSRHVRLTCEHRDPVERWTDRCPLPVIAMCLIQAYGAIAVLCTPWFASAMPLFGHVLTGWPARLLLFAFAAFSLYAARGFYLLQPRVWLAYTVVIVLMGLSAIVTFLQVNVLDFYRASGMPAAQVQQLAANPLLQENFTVWITALSTAVFAGYLLYLRRYFSSASRAR